MKTLDDALSVAAGIEPDTYEINGEFVYLASTEPGVLVDGIVTAQTLRRIADHLDPQPDSSPVIPEGWVLVPNEFDDWPEYHPEGMGCGLEDRGIHDRYEAMRYGWEQAIERLGERINVHLEADHNTPIRTEAEAQHLANRKGYEAFCRAIGMEPDCYEAIAHQVNARVVRVRREALEEAAKVCDAREKRCLAEKAKAGHDEAKFAGHYASKISADSAAAIRALIEKEPTA